MICRMRFPAGERRVPLLLARSEFCRRVTNARTTVNDFAAHCGIMRTPIGGGAYDGKTGFDTLSHHLTIMTSRLPIGFADMLTPRIHRRCHGVCAYVGLHRRRAARRIARHR
jgi:hypothetical protein